MEWKKDLEERDMMWRVELKERDEEYWRGQKEGDDILSRMMEARDQEIQNCLVSRDQEWLNGLHHCKESLRLMTMEQINNRVTFESVGKRQVGLQKASWTDKGKCRNPGLGYEDSIKEEKSVIAKYPDL